MLKAGCKPAMCSLSVIVWSVVDFNSGTHTRTVGFQNQGAFRGRITIQPSLWTSVSFPRTIDKSNCERFRTEQHLGAADFMAALIRDPPSRNYRRPQGAERPQIHCFSFSSARRPSGRPCPSAARLRGGGSRAGCGTRRLCHCPCPGRRWACLQVPHAVSGQ